MIGERLYDYRGIVTGVYDGDTITIDLDLGFGVWLRKQKVRLVGIDAPEMRGSEKAQGRIARDALREKILEKLVFIRTYRDRKGKYGRWLADVYCDQVFINEWMLTEGYAEIYK